MSLFMTSLASGSNGNCYYIGNDNEAVLIDAGISCRETEKRMKRLGLSMQKVKAIFISHEHSDHIRGLSVLAGRYQLPVYITGATLQNGSLDLDQQLVRSFGAHETVTIGALGILGFPKLHDAADPYSFIIRSGETCIGVFTDLGAPCENLIHYFRQCHAAFLETNYDVEMLEQGRYPIYLKRRISGGLGHLSNVQALEVFRTHRPPFMSHLFLSHLSKDNNRPELVQQLFEEHAEQVRIIVASRYEETEVYTIRAGTNTFPPDRKAIPHPPTPAAFVTPATDRPLTLNPHAARVARRSAVIPKARQTSLF